MENKKDPRKITCKICWKPLTVKKNVAKFVCMCDDDVRSIPLDKIQNVEYSNHIIDFQLQ